MQLEENMFAFQLETESKFKRQGKAAEGEMVVASQTKFDSKSKRQGEAARG